MPSAGEVIRATDVQKIMAAPTATASTGTVSSGTTETRDAVLGDYVFTASAGRRYRVIYDGLLMNTQTANDRYVVHIRNGGASTPDATSTLIAASAVVVTVTGTAGRPGVFVAGTFVPGAGTVTLSAFTLLATGTGNGAPVGNRELYVMDIGPQ